MFPRRRWNISGKRSRAEPPPSLTGSRASKLLQWSFLTSLWSFHRVIDRRLPKDWDADLPAFSAVDGPMATRVASGKTIAILGSRLPEMMGGSADLNQAPTPIEKVPEFRAGELGRTQYALRHSRACHGRHPERNGLHRGLIPYGGTFLVFSDYMRPPMRLAAMNALQVIYVFTHDSIGMGEDGPTHHTRRTTHWIAIDPSMVVLRPADANETVAAWRIAVGERRVPLHCPHTPGTPGTQPRQISGIPAGVPLGAYTLADSPAGAKPDIILIATGSEVHLAIEGRDRLATEGVQARVVSMPSTNLFASQSDDYRENILPTGVPLLVIEAGATLGWRSYIGPQIDVIGVDTFGASAPGKVVMEHYGFTVENVCKTSS